MEANADKPTILIMTDWYLPGVKAGGPIRSCVNFTRQMSDQYAIFILTADRDFNEDSPYPNIPIDEWTDHYTGAQVYYASPDTLKTRSLKDIITGVNPDFVYLNSMFSVWFTLVPLFLKWRGLFNAKVILAPRGMLHKGALQFKALKKNSFLTLAKLTRLTSNITFQATDQQEAKDIRRSFPKADITVLGNFPQSDQPIWISREKQAGEMNLVFVSRVAPKKNPLFLLECLKAVKGNIHLEIVGPIEEQAYWAKCQAIIDNFPGSHQVTLTGQVDHQEIQERLNKAHFFVLPTFGENFGHAIFEAFLAGCPVIISDQTPWQDLQSHKAGWDIPLNQPETYQLALTKAIQMDQAEYDVWSKGSWEFAKNFLASSNLKVEYQNLFS
ncbi:MAG: glycosyltransferase [Bacteroidota bacterium]